MESQRPKVRIVDYKASWPEEFAQIACVLKEGLGNLALRIDHIGSTSVPGLPAKDIIDLQITVSALNQDFIQAMEKLGYRLSEGYTQDHIPPGYRDEPQQWQKFYFRPPEGQRSTHTHVRIQGNPNQRYPLLFRDYLRTHPETAEAYARLKRMLAEHLADPGMYPDVKDPAVDLIYIPAEEWAKMTGWQPEKPDF